ncbi:MAG: YjbH domain-containing protein [Roseicyclus sp.]|nr:YjbH domain-containing protein [Roseicyclus sp.]MBO6623465.1 YjbH domain-containing protein [Roseicyclus sp.]MBO6920801.1 YjbH domain-containing protein [Roseicyclus sp.]
MRRAAGARPEVSHTAGPHARPRGAGAARAGMAALSIIVGLALPAMGQDLQPDTITRPSLNFFGATGLVDMPSAQMQPDGELNITVSHFGGITRNTLSFQITPRLSGSFRYAATADWNADGFETYYDRSFDLRYQVLEEGRYWPSVVIGLQDFVGTGIYAGEYVVASRRFGTDLTLTAGVGWGRLGSYNSFGAPVSGTRPTFDPNSTGGELSVDQWFRGEAAFFGGLEWRPTDRLGFKVEYSSDAYRPETGRGVFTRQSPWNFGVEYQVNDSLRLGGYYLYGSELGLTAQLSFNPARPPSGGLRQTAPPPIVPRPARAEAPDAWAQTWREIPGIDATLADRLRAALEAEGQILVAYDIRADSVEIRVENTRYLATAQAIGRTARVLHATMPLSVETFRIVLMDQGLALSTVVLRRSDLEALDVAPNAAEALRAVTGITAAAPTDPEDLVAELYPRLLWSLGPYTRTSFFDPENPVLLDLGLRLRGSYEFQPGWVVEGSIAQRLAGTLDRARVSPSRLPPVRTSLPLYEGNDSPVIETLTFAHYRSLGDDVYGRVTIGYLERMFAGVSAELLWAPVDSRLALGAEINYAIQRDYDMLFGVRDYDVVTGHLSAYYRFDNGFRAQLDVGRYLAGDLGATLTISREFANGWRVGAFATLTDASAEEFGEGSFDKGITLSIPVSWFTGRPSQQSVGTTIRPVTRDGGARLSVPGRLHDRVRQGQTHRIDDQWARVWR